jgi:tetratricopeptide (TPR) repeat protein
MKSIPQRFTLDFEKVSFPRLVCKAALMLGALLSLQLSSPALHAQAGAKSSADTSPAGPSLQELYDAAQNFQSAGKLPEAALQYRKFLAEALLQLARGYSAARDYAKARPMFEEAVLLTPDNSEIRLAYAEAADAEKDRAHAKEIAGEVLKAEPRNAKARVVLGRILLHLNQNEAAKQQFEAAVAIEPNFENGYALATAYLALKDEERAAKIFSEMLAGFGDSAEIHLSFGKACADASLPEQAIQEFKKAVSLNDRLPTAHYCLGAAYLQSMGEINDPEAAAEFRRELEINPDDFLSHFELGSIDLTDHKLQEAESELMRAESLNPQSPDPPLQLGEVYRQMNRTADAEAELQKSIALTQDVSRNHYQVQRAYYMLGRLLLVSGQAEEGKKAIETSDKLLQASVRENQGKADGLSNNEEAGAIAPKDVQESEEGNPEARKRVEAFEVQVRPAIADGFDNLGAIEAGAKDFTDALRDFEQAHEWEPGLEGLDYNWGRAAYSASEYQQAVGPLGRYLQAHPDDTWVRSALAMSFYKLKKCDEALKTFQGMQSLVDADPKTALAFAVCLVETGSSTEGMARLKELARDNPRDAGPHQALGEALASQGDLAGAAAEYRAALKSDPAAMEAKYGLAVTLIGLKQMIEARGLLGELVRGHSQNPGVYYQLGKMQLERGDPKAAITTLAAGEKISPENAAIHRELAEAYRKDLRKADAARETKLYETLQSKQPGASDPAKQN